LRNSAIFSPGTETETAAAAAPDEPTSVQQPAQKRGSVRSQPVARRASKGKNAITAPEAPAETASEVIAPVSQAANLTDTPTPVDAISAPIVAISIPALPEDDHVYSSEGAGVVGPRLTSLGFVHRLVSGLRVRTSAIELVVSKDGTVERAKIFSTPSHWEDALLLSRAKMFQFVPAHRNGSPVRYRFVMNVDTSP
jgi:hypothetical protein